MAPLIAALALALTGCVARSTCTVEEDEAVRETWLRPLGLVTEPNELGVYPPGALAVADNAVMRRPGLVSGLWAPTTLGAGPPAGQYVHRLHSTGQGGQFVYWSEGPAGVWSVTWVQTPLGIYTPATYEDASTTYTYNPDGRISPLMFRGRLLANSDQGFVVGDFINPQTTAERTLRNAGLPQPIIVEEDISILTNPQAVAEGTAVGYAAVLRRRYEADGYELISAPSPLQEYRNESTVSSANPRFEVAWGPSFGDPGRPGVREGDILELYRTAAQEFDLATNPFPAVGGTLYLVQRHEIDAGEATIGYATIIDDAGPDALGPELYTNPGADGAASARFRPPVARTVDAFKGYTFYGNLTLAATWIAGFPGGLGDLGTPGSRAHGIGVRKITSGTAAAGSATITSISPADMVGLSVGQKLHSFAGSGGYTSEIVSLGSGQLVAADVWTTAAGGSGPVTNLYAIDVVEVDGVEARMSALGGYIVDGGMMRDLWWTSGGTRWYSLITEINLAPHGNPYPPLDFQQRIALRAFSVAQGSIFVRGTNGQNYDPPIPLLTEAAKEFKPEVKENLIAWSWEQQPEGVGPGNYLPIGLDKVYRVVSAADSIYIFASSGLYRLTGYGVRSSGIGAQWNVENIDATLILSAPMAAAALRDSVYAYTNRGLVQIRGNQVDELSAGIVGNLLPGPYWQQTNKIFLATDPVNDEVWLAVNPVPEFVTWDGVLVTYLGEPVYTADLDDTDIFVYNTLTKGFTRQRHKGPRSWIGHASALHWSAEVEAMAFATHELGAEPQKIQHYDADEMGESDGFTCEFQPVSATDALMTKQWIDATVVTSPVQRDVGVFFGPNSDIATPVITTQLVMRANDSRANVGVPRSAPAIGETLRVGVIAQGSPPGVMAGPVELRGVSVRFEPLSDQQVFR